MRIGSLFSGYGGLDIGIGMILDAEPAWHVEFDKHPSAILAHHWPDVPNYGDVTAVDWDTVPPVDILTGGFPCQDVSHAGLRRGIKPGTRSGLWEHFAYAINTLRPRMVVIENVSGLLSADAAGDVEPCPWCLGDEPAGHMRALGAVLSDLAEVGPYEVVWGSVRASDAGAPHRRERVFIVAADTDNGRRAQRLRADIGFAAVVGDGGGSRVEDGDLTLLPTPKASDGPNGGPGMRNGRGVADALPGVVGQLLPTPAARDFKDQYVDNAGCHRPGDTDSVPRAVRDMDTDFGPYAAAIARWEQVLGRPAPSPTEPGSNGRPRLSPAFVEWMMGLPAGHVTGVGIPRSAQLKALGNGVVPQQLALALTILLPRLGES